MDPAISGIKLISFDLNGTIIRENTWVQLNNALGVTPEEDEQLLKLLKDGKMTYFQCQKQLQSWYVSRGKATFDNIADVLFRYHYLDGVRDTITYLKDKGYILSLISGSIDMVVARIAEDLEISDWVANNKMLFDSDGKLTKIDVTDEDKVFKLNALTRIVSSHGLNLNQCACVGDAANDGDIFKATGNGIAFTNSPAAKFAKTTINSLRDLSSAF
jgi:HAD superfamily phosphoserine phosphatase-like hydrolase